MNGCATNWPTRRLKQAELLIAQPARAFSVTVTDWPATVLPRVSEPFPPEVVTVALAGVGPPVTV